MSFSRFPGQVWAKTNSGDANSSCLNRGAQSWLPGLAGGAVFELSPLSSHPVIKGTTWNFLLGPPSPPSPELSPCTPGKALRRGAPLPLLGAFLKEPTAASGFMFTWQREVESPGSLNDWEREPEPGGRGCGGPGCGLRVALPHRPAPWGPEPGCQRETQTKWLACGKEVKVVPETNNT